MSRQLEDARALWAVRVLDAWVRAKPGKRSVEKTDNICITVEGRLRQMHAPSPDADAARFAAAEAVFPTLPADVREELGEKP